jgi:aldehyde dehydrogenase (NAD+)
MPEGKNFIDGRWVDAGSRRTFESHNPTLWQESVGVVPRSGPDDVELAVSAAGRAYHEWRALSRIKRGDYLDEVTQLVKHDVEDLAHLMAWECGKALNECRADVIEGIHMLQYTFGTARQPTGQVLASEIAEKEAYSLRKPKGVVACITPWNFPFAIPLWLIAPSLLEGNTVVFKPSEDTPVMGQRIAEYFEVVGLPPGVFNLVQGLGEEVGEPLVRHPDVKVILFTGSWAVGSHIKQVAASFDDKMAACEMGGKNAMIVCEDANLDIAVNAAVLSAFKTTGQRCVSAERLIVHNSLVPDFEERFVELTRHLKIGNPAEEDVFMGPLINPDAVEKTLSYNELAKRENSRVLYESGRLDGALEGGNFIGPFIYERPYDHNSRVLREEVFGPHVAVIPYQTLDEAIRIYQDSDYAFSMAVISDDMRKIRRIRDECDFGVGYVNLPTIGAEVHLPFGGLKRSGTGMPSAAAIVEVITHKVAWTVNYGTEIKMAQGLSSAIEGAPA